MKLSPLLVLGLFGLASCMGPTLYRDGKPIVRFNGSNLENVTYEDGPTKFTASKIDNSTPITAAGAAIRDNVMVGAAAYMLK